MDIWNNGNYKCFLLFFFKITIKRQKSHFKNCFVFVVPQLSQSQKIFKWSLWDLRRWNYYTVRRFWTSKKIIPRCFISPYSKRFAYSLPLHIAPYIGCKKSYGPICIISYGGNTRSITVPLKHWKKSSHVKQIVASQPDFTFFVFFLISVLVLCSKDFIRIKVLLNYYNFFGVIYTRPDRSTCSVQGIGESEMILYVPLSEPGRTDCGVALVRINPLRVCLREDKMPPAASKLLPAGFLDADTDGLQDFWTRRIWPAGWLFRMACVASRVCVASSASTSKKPGGHPRTRPRSLQAIRVRVQKACSKSLLPAAR